MNNNNKLKILTAKVDFQRGSVEPAYRIPPFKIYKKAVEGKEYHVSHTNIQVPYLNVPSFISAVRKIEEQLKDAEGLIGYLLTIKPLLSIYETFTVWEEPKFMIKFYTRGTHLEVMKRWRNEKLFHEEYADVRRSSITGSEIPSDGGNAREFVTAVKKRSVLAAEKALEDLSGKLDSGAL